MTDIVIVSLIGAAASVTASALSAMALIASNRNHAIAQRNETALGETKAEVQAIGIKTDGLTSALVKATGDAKLLEGIDIGHKLAGKGETGEAGAKGATGEKGIQGEPGKFWGSARWKGHGEGKDEQKAEDESHT